MSGLWATGVAVITTVGANGKYYGLTVNGLTSLSLDPPLFLICMDRKSHTVQPLNESKVFCINILAAGQQEIARRFATKGDHKFDRVAVVRGDSGAPLIAGSLASLECRVRDAVEGGDHMVYIGDVLTAHAAEGEPLLFYRGGFSRLHPST